MLLECILHCIFQPFSSPRAKSKFAPWGKFGYSSSHADFDINLDHLVGHKPRALGCHHRWACSCHHWRSCCCHHFVGFGGHHYCLHLGGHHHAGHCCHHRSRVPGGHHHGWKFTWDFVDLDLKGVSSDQRVLEEEHMDRTLQFSLKIDQTSHDELNHCQFRVSQGSSELGRLDLDNQVIRKGAFTSWNFEYLLNKNTFKRIRLKAGMLIESPFLTNHICSRYTFKTV